MAIEEVDEGLKLDGFAIIDGYSLLLREFCEGGLEGEWWGLFLFFEEHANLTRV